MYHTPIFNCHNIFTCVFPLKILYSDSHDTGDRDRYSEKKKQCHILPKKIRIVSR